MKANLEARAGRFLGLVRKELSDRRAHLPESDLGLEARAREILEAYIGKLGLGDEATPAEDGEEQHDRRLRVMRAIGVAAYLDGDTIMQARHRVAEETGEELVKPWGKQVYDEWEAVVAEDVAALIIKLGDLKDSYEPQNSDGDMKLSAEEVVSFSNPIDALRQLVDDRRIDHGFALTLVALFELKPISAQDYDKLRIAISAATESLRSRIRRSHSNTDFPTIQARIGSPSDGSPMKDMRQLVNEECIRSENDDRKRALEAIHARLARELTDLYYASLYYHPSSE